MSHWKMPLAALAFATLIPAGANAAEDLKDVPQGNDDPQLVFNNNCRKCHVTEKGENRLGPSLYGVFGRKSGQAPGFHYSDAIKDGSVTWDAATLDKWIENPDQVAPGNNMKKGGYTGINDPKVRKQIIAYLKKESQAAGKSGGSAKSGKSGDKMKKPDDSASGDKGKSEEKAQ